MDLFRGVSRDVFFPFRVWRRQRSALWHSATIMMGWSFAGSSAMRRRLNWRGHWCILLMIAIWKFRVLSIDRKVRESKEQPLAGKERAKMVGGSYRRERTTHPVSLDVIQRAVKTINLVWIYAQTYARLFWVASGSMHTLHAAMSLWTTQRYDMRNKNIFKHFLYYVARPGLIIILLHAAVNLFCFVCEFIRFNESEGRRLRKRFFLIPEILLTT